MLTVPDTHPRLAFVLATMAGHLFGYEAALAIDAQARPLREARAAIDTAVAGSGGDLHGEHVDGEHLLVGAAPCAGPAGVGASSTGCAAAATTATSRPTRRCASPGSSATRSGISPLDAYQVEFGKVGTPGVVLEDLSAGLTAAIEELTRPVDAIKHQAKTVTVGISRSDESLLQVAAGRGRARGPARPATASPTRRCARSVSSTPPWSR